MKRIFLSGMTTTMRIFILVVAIYSLCSSSSGQIPDCSEIFISEYVDGTGNDKALELFNPTEYAIDLQGYSIQVFHNGAPTALTTNLSGVVASKDVFVLTNPQAISSIRSIADQTSPFYNPNGDDAIALVKNGSVVLDIVGVIGIDPGNAGWSVPPGSTKGYTLVRKPTINHGDSSWTNCQNEWQIHPQNTLTFLGAHQSTCQLSQAYTIGITNFTYTFLDPSYYEGDCACGLPPY